MKSIKRSHRARFTIHSRTLAFYFILLLVSAVPRYGMALDYECPLPQGDRDARGDYACDALLGVMNYQDELHDIQREFRAALREFERCRRRMRRCYLRQPHVVQRLEQAIDKVEGLFQELVAECMRSYLSQDACERKEARKYCRQILHMNNKMRQARNLRQRIYRAKRMLRAMRRALRNRQRDLAEEAIQNGYWCACLVLPAEGGPGVLALNPNTTCTAEPPMGDEPVCGEFFLSTGAFAGVTSRVAEEHDQCRQPEPPISTPTSTPFPLPDVSPTATPRPSGSYPDIDPSATPEPTDSYEPLPEPSISPDLFGG